MEELCLDLPADKPVVFAADIHLKDKWSSALSKLTEDSATGLAEYRRVCLSVGACAIVLGGDIFDVNFLRHPWLQRLFFSWVDSMMADGIKVLAYAGNHDFVYSVDPTEAATVNYTHFHQVHPAVIDIDQKWFRHGDRVYVAVAFQNTGDLIIKALKDCPEEVNTLMLHQLTSSFGGSVSLTDVVPAHIDQVLIGDVHSFEDGTLSDGTWWGYPGAMYPQRIGEHQHGTFVVSSDPKAIPERFEIHARKVLLVEGILDEPVMEQRLTQVLSQADAVVEEFMAQMALGADLSHLEAIMVPEVRVRTIRPLLRFVKQWVRDHKSDHAHFHIELVNPPVKTVTGEKASADQAPTVIELMPDFMTELRGDEERQKRFCPEINISEQLVHELLISGPDGVKAGDDDMRADGQPLQHKKLISSILNQIDEEEDRA